MPNITERSKIVRINITNTPYYIEGKRQENDMWQLKLISAQTGQNKTYRQKRTLDDFVSLVHRVFNQPFPYLGKTEPKIDRVDRFIKKLIKIRDNN